MYRESKFDAKKITVEEALSRVTHWQFVAVASRRDGVGFGRDWALNRADWWLGVYRDLAGRDL